MAKLQVTHSYSVNSTVLALRIETGEIIRGKQVRYEAKPGDKVSDKNYVRRNGEDIGRLIEGGKKIRLFDEFKGEDLDEQWATQAQNYSINGVKPKNVFIKSKPGNSARTGPWDFKFPMEHTVILEIPETMKAGQKYQLDIKGDELADIDFTFSPGTVRSEAVHVSHLGFHPDDPSKVAFLSTWMGPKGKGVSYEPGQKMTAVRKSLKVKLIFPRLKIRAKIYSTRTTTERMFTSQTLVSSIKPATLGSLWKMSALRSTLRSAKTPGRMLSKR